MTVTFDHIMARLDEIPAISSAAIQALAIIEDPTTDAHQIENLVRVDPLLTSSFLRLANASCFGLSGSVSTLRGAITRLGWKKTRDVLSAAALSGVIPQRLPGYHADARAYWAHSVATACIAERLGKLEGDAIHMTFVVGLLHDVGRLAIGSVIELVAPRAIGLLESNDISFAEFELDYLGMDHAAMGERLLRAWRLPEHIATAVGAHHDPTLATGGMSNAATLVHVADVATHGIGYGSSPRDGDETHKAVHQPSQERIEEAAEACVDQLEELVGLFESTRA